MIVELEGVDLEVPFVPSLDEGMPKLAIVFQLDFPDDPGHGAIVAGPFRNPREKTKSKETSRACDNAWNMVDLR